MPSPRPKALAAEQPVRKGFTFLIVIALMVGASATRLAVGEWSPWLGLPPLSDLAVPGDIAKQIELGRRLFLEPHLAEDGVISCSTCHVPEHGFSLNVLPTSTGRGGQTLRRNAPSLLNVAIAKSLFHDGRELALEDQIWGPLLSTQEQWNPSVDAVVSRLRARPEYDKAFRSAFAGQRVTKQLIGAALAAYERSLVAAGSSFDQWYYGKVTCRDFR